MTVKIRTITFDAGPDHYAVGMFWAELLGYGDAPDNPNYPGDPETRIVGPDDGPGILFLPVPKSVKNRVHLDLEPQDETRDALVERALGLGAGNEFCVEGSAAERARLAQSAT